MFGLILAGVLFVLMVVFSNIPIEGIVIISSSLLFVWYLVSSIPRILFALFVLGMMIFGGSFIAAKTISKPPLAGLLGLGSLLAIGGGISAIAAIRILAPNIFLISGAYLVSIGIDVDPFSLGPSYEYEYARLIIGAIFILAGILLKQRTKLIVTPRKYSIEI